MRVFIPFQNPKTGEIRKVKLGFSWTLFFFSMFFGIPLFMRKLTTMGCLMLAFILGNILLSKSGAGLLPNLGLWALVIWLGFKGNAMTAKRYLELGWTWVEPDDAFSKIAQQKWGLTIRNQTPVESTPLSQPAASAPLHTSVANPSAINSKTILAVIGGIAFLAFLAFTGQLTSTGNTAHTTTYKEAAKPARIEPAAEPVRADYDINGLPKCDSDIAKKTVISAIANNAYNKVANFQILSFEEIGYLAPPTKTDKETLCNAETLTNMGKQHIDYTISKTKDGGVYVEVH